MFSISRVAAVVAAIALALPLTAGAQRTPAMPAMSSNLTLTAVDGIRVGHFTLSERPTGCTVIVADGDGAVAGVAQRGGAPGTRETNLLDPDNLVERVNAIVLTGGSAYGLDTATGVMKYLEEKKMGFNVGVGVVPEPESLLSPPHAVRERAASRVAAQVSRLIVSSNETPAFET